MARELVEQYDLDKDGKVTDAEIELKNKMETLQNLDQKSDAQKKMAWFALWGMLLYPVCIILSTFFGMGSAATILGGMAATYFGSVAVIVSAFFGAEAFIKNKLL